MPVIIRNNDAPELRFAMGFSKWVVQVWVWYWMLAHHVPILRYCGYAQVNYNNVSLISNVLKLVFSYILTEFSQ